MQQPLTRAQLADRLDSLAERMLEVATELDYYGGFDQQLNAKAAELAGAAGIAQNWAWHIRNPQESADEAQCQS